MNALLKALPKTLQAQLKKCRMPKFEKPMLATLTKDYFSDKEWLYERKFDGVRCLILKNKNEVTIKSRNNNITNHSYPELEKAFSKIDAQQIILDGEIVALENAISSFKKLQARLGVKNPSKELIKKVPVYVYIFDILYLDGYDLTKLPLVKRKYILKHALSFSDPLRYVTHKNTQGLPFYKQACKKGWEGIIAKKTREQICA